MVSVEEKNVGFDLLDLSLIKSIMIDLNFVYESVEKSCLMLGVQLLDKQIFKNREGYVVYGFLVLVDFRRLVQFVFSFVVFVCDGINVMILGVSYYCFVLLF